MLAYADTWVRREARLSMARTMLERESGRTITVLVAGYNLTVTAEISYRYPELPSSDDGSRFSDGVFSSSLCLAKCRYVASSHVVSCAETSEQQQKVVQEGNRSRMTIDHKGAPGVSDTPALPQRLRQG